MSFYAFAFAPVAWQAGGGILHKCSRPPHPDVASSFVGNLLGQKGDVEGREHTEHVTTNSQCMEGPPPLISVGMLTALASSGIDLPTTIRNCIIHMASITNRRLQFKLCVGGIIAHSIWHHLPLCIELVKLLQVAITL
jgi:hypothetical protein